MANYQVTPGGNTKFEPSVAVHLLSPNIIVATATDNTTGSPLVGLYRSIDGGVNWVNTLLPIPAGFAGAEAAFVAYGFGDLFIVVAHAFPVGAAGTVIVYRSTDSGATFSAPVIVNQGYGTFINNDATSIRIDRAQKSPYQGNVYLNYTRQTNIDFNGKSLAFYQRSTDQGVSWDNPKLMSNPDDTVTERPFTAVDLNGNVYFSWIDAPPSAPSFYIRRSFDGGGSFGPQILVSPVSFVPSPLPVSGYAFRCLTWPAIAVDTSLNPLTSNTIYAVWQDNRQGYADIFMSKSQDLGTTWSTPRSVTNATSGSQNFFPAIDVSSQTGAVRIIYYTNKLDGFLLNVFVAESNDGGATFTNRQVTTASSNPNAGSPTPVVLIGDYIDVSIVPTERFIAVWMDTRTGTQTIFAGNLDP
ncbi:exo-alpha-sialidase [Paenibacillus solisilvae]|uniref:exo-alpha-sialidase n=1 Tax=Paenibacillus solisilvae TaxID=2486751 RepID=A0ABW0W5K0_9BACL